MTNNMPRDHARAYAARGWAVFPVHTPRPDGSCSCGRQNCGDIGKHPRTAHGCKDATQDAAQVDQWWDTEPTANVGIATGADSGLIVLDLDSDQAVDEATRRGLPPTPVVRTAKGLHLYFRHPGGRIKNRANVAAGMDIRADGGYVVAPPSVHPTGTVYEWEVSPDQAKLADLPDWLLHLVSPSPVAADPRHDPRNYTQLDIDGIDYGARILLDRWTAQVRQSTNGTRNDTLNRAAYTLGGLVGACRLPAALVETELTAAAIAVGLDQHEATKTIRSGLDAGTARPIENRPGQVPPQVDGDRPTAPAPRSFRRTDYGNAERMIARHGLDLRYCHPWGKWLVWDGRRWVVDETAEVERRAKETVRSIYAEVARYDDDTERAALAKWAAASEAAGKIGAMISLAASEPDVPVTPDTLDADPWTLNVQNGVLNLKTGELQPHSRDLNITKLAPVPYDPTATAPTWAAFLDRIMDHNPVLITFLQRAIGYSLTGKTSERVLFILHGKGKNGKSTLIEVVRALVGDYGARTPTETLMVKQQGAIPNDVARLKAARFVSASESEDGQRLAESLIKDLTGQDTISARFLRAEWFEFRPEFKIWLATNHRPVIRGSDDGIWDRIRLIPFAVRIPDDEQDPHLLDKLRAELPGILAWAVRGCLDWQAHGLTCPPEVKAATEDYRASMDVLGEWLDACCVVGPNVSTGATALLESYKAYTGETLTTATKFGLRLKERGFRQEHARRGKVWLGLGLRADADPPRPGNETLMVYPRPSARD